MKAIFFDIDETLHDHKYSMKMGVKSFYDRNKAFLPYHEKDFLIIWDELTEKYFQKYISGELTFEQQRRARIREIFDKAQIGISDQECDKEFQFYMNEYNKNYRLFPDVQPCLESVSDYHLGIISNGDADIQHEKLEQLKIKNRFKTIVISGDFGIPKPDKAIFLEASKRAGYVPRECCYVGDRKDIDAIASQEAGFQAIWINRKSMDVAEGKIKTIHSLSELKETLSEMP